VAAIALAVAARFTTRVAAAARPADRAAAWSAVAIVLVTAIPVLAIANPDGIGFRLRVAVFAPAALVAAIVVGRATAALAPALRLAVIAPMLAVRLWRSTPRRARAWSTRTRRWWRRWSRCPAGCRPTPWSSRRSATWASWSPGTRGCRCACAPSPVPPARRWRLLAGNLIGLGSPLDQALRAAHDRPGLVAPVGTHPYNPSGVVFVPEATWDLGADPGAAQAGGGAYWRRWPTR
jgi:hypothetical protein